MIKKIITVIIIAAAVLSLISCGRTAERITDEEVMPIQNAIDAVLSANAEKYRNVFPPAYDKEISDLYTVLEGIEFDEYIKNMFEKAASGKEDSYGKKIGTEFVVSQKTELDIKKENELFEYYSDANVLYVIDLSAIDKAIKVTGILSVWGKTGDADKEASFVLFRQDGIWYLHPVYYFFTFTV